MKNILKYFLSQLGRLLFFLTNNGLGIYISDSFLSSKINRKKRISIKKINFCLHTPTYLTNYRYRTFFTKEPETIEWIDNFKKNSVFYDIGANVGLYSIYASIRKNSKVFSFEPSFFNLELLARNIYSNKMDNKIVIIPLPLNDKISISNFDLTSTDWGGALSTFEKGFNDSGETINTKFSYKTLGINLDKLVKTFNLPNPSYIKIDVDGLEHFIISGGRNLISKANEILIEVNDNFLDQNKKVNYFLNEAGFKLDKKVYAHPKTRGVANQIWKRKI